MYVLLLQILLWLSIFNIDMAIWNHRIKKNCIRDLEEGEEVPVTSTKSAFIQFKYKTRVYIDEEHWWTNRTWRSKFVLQQITRDIL